MTKLRQRQRRSNDVSSLRLDRHGSGDLQTAASDTENILERKGAGQSDVDTATTNENVCGDLQQARTNGSRGGGGQLSSLERESAKPLHHQRGKGGEKKTQLISLHPMGAGARGEEIQLLLFDLVFRFPALAIEVLITVLGLKPAGLIPPVYRQVGHDEAGIVLVAEHLGLADEGAGPRPGILRSIREGSENPRFAATQTGPDPRLEKSVVQLLEQARMAGHADRVMDARMVFTPSEKLLATEPAVAADNHSDVREALANRRDDFRKSLDHGVDRGFIRR